MLLQIALRLSKIELIHRERSLRRRLLEHLARFGAQRPSDHLVHQRLDVLAAAMRGVGVLIEVVLGQYSPDRPVVGGAVRVWRQEREELLDLLVVPAADLGELVPDAGEDADEENRADRLISRSSGLRSP